MCKRLINKNVQIILFFISIEILTNICYNVEA